MSDASRDRTRLAGLVLCGVFVVMAGRGGYLALSGAPKADAVQVAAQTEQVRADILDRDGELLATSVKTSSLWINPSLIWDPEEAYTSLVGLFPELANTDLRERLADTKRKFVWVKRGLTPRQQEAVMDLGLEGLGFREEWRRAYPMGTLAGQVLGQTNVDGKGIAGIELSANEALAAGEKPVRLTLDVESQTALELELEWAATEFNIDGGSAILMDTHTGEIRAMASWPVFDPNRAADIPSKDPSRLNRAIGAVYELGSVYKPLTIAAALDAGAVTRTQRFDVSEPIRTGGFTIRDTHSFGKTADVTDIIIESSNIGTVHVARAYGAKRQEAFLKEAGLMSKAAVELPGSEAPIVPARLDETAAAAVSYGHAISVSPMAFLPAFAALGNGGVKVAPTLLANPDRKPETVTLFSAETAEDVVAMMRASVLRGTGLPAEVAGYRVAGKTGTGEKPIVGGYDKNSNISSFAAVFPADGPQYALIVTLDNPKAHPGRAATAAGSAAPVAGRIVERVAPILGVTPRFEDIRQARPQQSERSPERSSQ